VQQKLYAKEQILAGVDIFNVDHMVIFEKTIKVFKGTNTVANGNLDPVTHLLQGTHDSVVESVASFFRHE